MKKNAIMCIAFFVGILTINAQTYEYKIITSVESIVPGGIGRSRIIATDAVRHFEDFTSGRTVQNNTRNKSSRSAIRVKKFEETKLLNFFNLVGIRFQNIAANDAVMTSKINSMVAEGWDLAFVNSGVESDAGKGDGAGIFITRYIFKRPI